MLIRTRLTVASMVVLVMVAGMLVGFNYRAQAAAETRYVGEVLSGKQALLRQLAARIQDRMAGYSRAMTRDRTLLKALRSGDHATVGDQAATTHNMLLAEGAVERLQVFDRAGRYLASFPKIGAGITGKSLVHSVLSENKAANGINRDDDGSLQVITAFPLFGRGKLIGVAVYSQGMQAVLDALQHSDGSDTFVFDTDGRLEASGSGNQAASVTLPGYSHADGGLEVVRQDDRYHVNVAIPVPDENANPLAHLVISQDQTETYAVQAASTYWSVGLLVLALCGSAMGLFWYIRRTFRPIGDVVDCMTKVATGNLHCLPDNPSRDDETGRLTRGLHDMVEKLNGLVGQIMQVTDRLIGSTNDLTAIAEQGNARIARQREETDQVATAATQMAATTREVAQSAAAAAQAARVASDRTRDGCDVIDRTRAAIESLVQDITGTREVIGQLRDQSETIGSVLDVIRGIAEQTNLLALNAAIEAARAGEQGRGFAVVADEVRTLASRTQQSTEEIQAMISALQQGTGRAVDAMEHSNASSTSTLAFAGSAHEALAEIQQAVNEITAMNGQIAGAADAQSTVSESISRSVSAIAALAEESLAATGQTATAATEIAATGEELGMLVKHFDL